MLPLQIHFDLNDDYNKFLLMTRIYKFHYRYKNYESSKPACCSIALKSLVLNTSSSLITGTLSKFRHVLAVGIRSSFPDD